MIMLSTIQNAVKLYYDIIYDIIINKRNRSITRIFDIQNIILSYH